MSCNAQMPANSLNMDFNIVRRQIFQLYCALYNIGIWFRKNITTKRQRHTR